jgi:glycosyltransferase involved in cell wall biosynthesis
MTEHLKKERPMVSVLMTAYNREKFIVEAIESVIASTYTDWELIITDDCSTDNTLAVARDFEKKDRRIKVYLNEKNLGDYPNRNKAASYAIGRYIMFVDSDDIIFADGIENTVSLMLQYPDAGFGMRLFVDNTKPYVLDSETIIRDHFFKSPVLMIGPGGTIIKRIFFENIKGYPEKYGPANDMYFNLKAALHTPIVLIPFEYMFYRRHDGQEINNKYGYLINSYLYLYDALESLRLPLTPNEIDYLQKKNKRRFLVNLVKYFISTRNISKTRFAVIQTGFNVSDFFSAIFH